MARVLDRNDRNRTAILRQLRPGHVAGVVGLGLLAVLASTRRLNFDEALALHAGWLDLAGIDARPAFLMPWTLLVGALAHALPDPGTLFLVLRLGTVAAIAAAFARAARSCGLDRSATGLAGLLAVLNAAFGVHGLEFRYDAAILLGLLAAAALLARPGPVAAAGLGALAGWLALHHLKGAFFAVGVLALLFRVSSRRARDGARFALGAGAVVLAWAVLVGALGLLPRWIDSLEQFFDLAGGSRRAPFVKTMGPVLMADLAWWLVVLTTIVLSIARRRVAARGGSREVLLALAGLGIVFWVLHPHAWPYLAALPVALLSLLTVAEVDLRRHGRWLVALLVAGLLIQATKSAWRPLDYVRRSFAAPVSQEVAALRRLSAALLPGDRVLDPSGIAYFIPPCTRDWYVDTLFAEGIPKGWWMSELTRGVPASCTLAIDTYRLGALPPPAVRGLRREFVSVGGGVAVRVQRSSAGFETPFAGPDRIESFW